MNVYSEFWEGDYLPEGAKALLRQFGDPSESLKKRVHALTQLLEQGSAIARGVALDNFSMLHAERRHGGAQSLADEVEPAVRACAVRELEAPPYQRAEAEAKPRLGANHGSAFYAMWAFVTKDDSALIARALAQNDDPSVLWFGVKAASGAIYRQSDVDPRLVEVLQHLGTDPDQDPKVRAAAIGATARCTGDIFIPWLISALSDKNEIVIAAATRALLERDKDRFRGVVEAIVAQWTSSIETLHDAMETRRLLEGEDDGEDDPEE